MTGHFVVSLSWMLLLVGLYQAIERINVLISAIVEVGAPTAMVFWLCGVILGSRYPSVGCIFDVKYRQVWSPAL